MTLWAHRKYKSGTGWCVWRWTEVDSEFIVRLHLVKTPWFALCVHWIRKPDPEPYLHDHPVSFLSFILSGAYAEIRDGMIRWREHFNFICATDAHSIIAVDPNTVTLCFMGPKVREWGYHTPQGWVCWRDYFAAQRQDHLGFPVTA